MPSALSMYIPIVMLLLALGSVTAYDPNGVHILFLTDCTEYSNWQTISMAFAYKNSGQKGKITRVMCCTEEEDKKYPKEFLEVMETHVAPSYARNNKTDDFYPAYNKPGAVLHFMEHGSPDADWILVIDSDMILRHPFDPEHHKMEKGHALSADYRYMVGCTNDLAKRHIPEIAAREDTLAGPKGRWCDQVGGWVFMHKDDLTRVAPKWLSETVDVREDPESWHLTGDQYVEKGGKAWISEMYGYAFACAKESVWHQWDLSVMHYPTYRPHFGSIPKLIHYGLEFKVGEFVFDKHWQYELDVRKCAPWNLTEIKQRKGGIFQHPPRPTLLPDSLKKTDNQYYGHLISIETVATMNAGFCHYHLDHCPPSIQMLEECTTAWDIYKEVKEELEMMEAKIACLDLYVKCGEWAEKKQCEDNKNWMTWYCRKACKQCSGQPIAPGPMADPLHGQGSTELQEALSVLKEKLQSTGEISADWGKDKEGTATRWGGSAEGSGAKGTADFTGSGSAGGAGGEAGSTDEDSAGSLKDEGAGSLEDEAGSTDEEEETGMQKTVALNSQDPDDLTLRQKAIEPVIAPSDTVTKLGVLRRQLSGGSGATYTPIIVGGFIVTAVLVGVIRVYKGSTRARSGMRSE